GFRHRDIKARGTMPDIFDIDAAKATLGYWLDVEALTPATLDSDSGEGNARALTIYDDAGPIDWAMGCTNERERSSVINVVRFGLFEPSEAGGMMAAELRVASDEEHDSARGKPSFLAAFVVGPDGHPVKRTLKVTLFAMRFESIGKAPPSRAQY